MITSRLRPLSSADVELTFFWRNREAVRNAMYHTAPIELAGHGAWIERTVADATRDYSIFEMDGRPIGIVGIIWINRNGGLAEWSFHIGAPDASRGSGTIMLELALTRFFDEIGGRKMCAEVIADNIRSLALHDRLGFFREGVRRSHIIHRGIIKDIVEFGLLASDRTLRSPAPNGAVV